MDITKVISCKYEQDKKYIQLTHGVKNIVLKLELEQWVDIAIDKRSVNPTQVCTGVRFIVNPIQIRPIIGN